MALTHLQLILTTQTLQDDPTSMERTVGAMTTSQIHFILHAAREIETIDTIHCIGGEPFLNYPVLLQAIHGAHANGYETIVVTNAFWATSVENARSWLEPMRSALHEIRLRSAVPPHNSLKETRIEHACEAAEELGIRVGRISMIPPSTPIKHDPDPDKLIGQSQLQAWHTFTTCPYRDLQDPEYLTVDPFGYVHICEGVAIGNMQQEPLRKIWDTYLAPTHPIAGVLLRGGPAALIAYYGLEAEGLYVDACELCRKAREQLRDQLPDLITPESDTP